jgi:hypothetical protein
MARGEKRKRASGRGPLRAREKPAAENTGDLQGADVRQIQERSLK